MDVRVISFALSRVGVAEQQKVVMDILNKGLRTMTTDEIAGLMEELTMALDPDDETNRMAIDLVAGCLEYRQLLYEIEMEDPLGGFGF